MEKQRNASMYIVSKDSYININNLLPSDGLLVIWFSYFMHMASRISREAETYMHKKK